DLVLGPGTVIFDVGGNIPDDSEISANISSFPGFTGDDSWWTNLWHHWVFLKNGLNVKQIWVDGQIFVEEVNGATPTPTDFSTICLVWAGGGQAGTVLNMNGEVDDFAIFGTALTTNQIQQLFSGTLPSALPASAQALAWWDFTRPVVRPLLNITRSGAV